MRISVAHIPDRAGIVKHANEFVNFGWSKQQQVRPLIPHTSHTTRSKFNYIRTIGTIMVTVVCTSVLAWMIYAWITDDESVNVYIRAFFTVALVIYTPMLIGIELAKIRRLQMGSDGIVIINPLTGRRRTYPWTVLDGYLTFHALTKTGFVDEIILMRNDKIVHEISSEYINNYQEIRKEIEANLKHLGKANIEPLGYIWERLIG